MITNAVDTIIQALSPLLKVMAGAAAGAAASAAAAGGAGGGAAAAGAAASAAGAAGDCANAALPATSTLRPSASETRNFFIWVLAFVSCGSEGFLARFTCADANDLLQVVDE